MLSFRGSSVNTLVATANLVPLRNSRLIFLQRVRGVSVHVLSKFQPSTFITKDSETASLEVVGYRGVKDACRGESRASELHFPVRVVARSSGEPGAPPALSAAPPSSNSRSGWCWLERQARHLSRALRRATELLLPVWVVFARAANEAPLARSPPRHRASTPGPGRASTLNKKSSKK